MSVFALMKVFLLKSAECPKCNGKMDLSETALIDSEHFTPEVKDLLKELMKLNNDVKYFR